MITALWLEQDLPAEYVELILCRDVFHCRPSELRLEDAVDVENALACLSAEAYVRKARG